MKTDTNGQSDLLTRIRGELRGERVRLEGELATVRQVQQAIDPRTRPRKKRASVARIGDRYDLTRGPRGGVKVAKNASR